MWKVYGLIDPRDGRIRYIGCTGRKQLSARLNHHVGSATGVGKKGWDARRNRWIREVLAEGFRPTITELERYESQEEGWAAEKRWIARLRPQLVNDTGGGPGITNPSDELRERLSIAISEAQVEAWARDDGTRRAQIAAIGKSNKGRPNPAAALANKGRPLPESQKAAIRAHHQTPEFRERMSEIKKGTVVSDETRAKQSVGIKAAKARKKAEFLALPDEVRERILQEKSERARVKKNEAQQRRRAARKIQ